MNGKQETGQREGPNGFSVEALIPKHQPPGLVMGSHARPYGFPSWA
jgi:hypothetical protein